MAVALLAGFGLAWLLARVRTSRWVPAAAALALVTAEAAHAPIRTEPFAGVPPIYSLLSGIDAPVLLVEVPFWPPDVMHENAEYVLNATARWRPVMNGYSGFARGPWKRCGVRAPRTSWCTSSGSTTTSAARWPRTSRAVAISGSSPPTPPGIGCTN